MPASFPPGAGSSQWSGQFWQFPNPCIIWFIYDYFYQQMLVNPSTGPLVIYFNVPERVAQNFLLSQNPCYFYQTQIEGVYMSSTTVVTSFGGLTGAILLSAQFNMIGNTLFLTSSIVNTFGGQQGNILVGSGLMMVGNTVQAIVPSLSPSVFGPAFTTWFNSLPTSTTGQSAGAFINSGGLLEQVQP